MQLAPISSGGFVGCWISAKMKVSKYSRSFCLPVVSRFACCCLKCSIGTLVDHCDRRAAPIWLIAWSSAVLASPNFWIPFWSFVKCCYWRCSTEHSTPVGNWLNYTCRFESLLTVLFHTSAIVIILLPCFLRVLFLKLFVVHSVESKSDGNHQSSLSTRFLSKSLLSVIDSFPGCRRRILSCQGIELRGWWWSSCPCRFRFWRLLYQTWRWSISCICSDPIQSLLDLLIYVHLIY